METRKQDFTLNKAYLPTSEKPLPNSRELKEMSVYNLLEKLEIQYLRVDHEMANTVEDCHNVDEILGVHICKNLFLCNSQKTDFLLQERSICRNFLISPQVL